MKCNGMLVKEKWFITLIWHAITFLIYFDISFDLKIKKKIKNVYLLQEEKRKKEKNQFNSTDSESDMLTTLPYRHHKYAGLN